MIVFVLIMFHTNTNDRKDMGSRMIDKVGTRKPAGMNGRLYWPTASCTSSAVRGCVCACVYPLSGFHPVSWTVDLGLDLLKFPFLTLIIQFISCTNYHHILHKLCTFSFTSFIHSLWFITDNMSLFFLRACACVCFCCLSFWALRQPYPLRFNLLVHFIGH